MCWLSVFSPDTAPLIGNLVSWCLLVTQYSKDRDITYAFCSDLKNNELLYCDFICFEKTNIKGKIRPSLELGWGGFRLIIYSGRNHPWRSFQRCQKASHCSKWIQQWLDFVWTKETLHQSSIVIIFKETVQKVSFPLRRWRDQTFFSQWTMTYAP